MKHRGAEAVDVGAFIEGPALDLLRRAVLRSAEQLRIVLRIFSEITCETEVDQFDLTSGIDEQVRWFDIAVNDATAHGRTERPGCRDRNSNRFRGREWTFFLYPLIKTGTLQQFHHQVGQILFIVNGVNLTDIGVTDGGDRSGLGKESIQHFFAALQTGVDALDGHGSLQARITRPIDHTHATFTDLFLDGEGADPLESRDLQRSGLVV